MSNSADAAETITARRAGAIALLGMLAATELTAFERLSAATANAPTIADKAELGALANVELQQFVRLRDALAERGADPELVVSAYVGPIHAFHERTRPGDWYEDLMKAYIADSMVADFFREAARLVDDRTRSVVLEALSDTGLTSFARRRIFAAAGADSRLSGRLALWGRRLVGEAMSQAQQVFVTDPAFAALLDEAGAVLEPSGGRAAPAGPDGVAGIDGAAPAPRNPGPGRILVAMTESHARRMAALGMSA